MIDWDLGESGASGDEEKEEEDRDSAYTNMELIANKDPSQSQMMPVTKARKSTFDQ